MKGTYARTSVANVVDCRWERHFQRAIRKGRSEEIDTEWQERGVRTDPGWQAEWHGIVLTGHGGHEWENPDPELSASVLEEEAESLQAFDSPMEQDIDRMLGLEIPEAGFDANDWTRDCWIGPVCEEDNDSDEERDGDDDSEDLMLPNMQEVGPGVACIRSLRRVGYISYTDSILAGEEPKPWQVFDSPAGRVSFFAKDITRG